MGYDPLVPQRICGPCYIQVPGCSNLRIAITNSFPSCQAPGAVCSTRGVLKRGRAGGRSQGSIDLENFRLRDSDTGGNPPLLPQAVVASVTPRGAAAPSLPRSSPLSKPHVFDVLQVRPRHGDLAGPHAKARGLSGRARPPQPTPLYAGYTPPPPVAQSQLPWQTPRTLEPFVGQAALGEIAAGRPLEVTRVVTLELELAGVERQQWWGRHDRQRPSPCGPAAGSRRPATDQPLRPDAALCR
eukprot:SAG11_NODE_4853_length_1745_cov_5.738761_1_plen_241_part_01